MDPVLTRASTGRQENKISMRTPAWPDSPLHQYFGAKKSTQKDTNFVMSSLGYLRLYQYCFPQEKPANETEEPKTGGSFVHLEERLRSDGPYVLYQRNQTRRLGLDLTERAREKKLLKYYKYFQGFQRKLQVSKQFQENHQRPGNKAKVEKIIGLYKPNSSGNSKESSQNKQNHVTTGSIAQESSVSKKDLITDLQVKNGKMCAKAKKNTSLFEPERKDGFSIKSNELALIDINANQTGKRKERSTVIVPTLETIEESFSDCDYSDLEPDLIPGHSNCQHPYTRPEHTVAQHALPESVNNSLQGNQQQSRERDQTVIPKSILKKPKQTNVGNVPKKEEVESKEASSSSINSDTKTIKKKVTKRNSIKKIKLKRQSLIPADIGHMNADINPDGKLYMSQDCALLQKVSKKSRRVRPALKRSSASGASEYTKRVSIKTDDFEEVADEEDNSESIQEVLIRGADPPEEVKASIPLTSLTNAATSENKNPASHKRSGEKNTIKFPGWDYGTSLKPHMMKHLPEEKDLLRQVLQRAETSKWGDDPNASILDDEADIIVKDSDSYGKDPRAYLMEHDISCMFQQYTRTLIERQPNDPLELFKGMAHTLAVQHHEKKNILKNLRTKEESTNPDSVAMSRVSYQTEDYENRIGSSFLPEDNSSSPDQVEEGKTSFGCPICDAVAGSLFVDVGKSHGAPKHYYLSYLSLNSYDSQYACERISGHLAEINTATELDQISTGLDGMIYNGEGIHIGGHVNYPEGTITSSLQSAHSLFVDWHTGQPDSQGTGECVILRKRPFKPGVKMDDVNCTAIVTRFLCEIGTKSFGQ